MIEAYLLANKALKLVWTDLTQTFESGDLWIGFEVFDSLQTFLFGVAIAGLLLVLDAEEWRLEDLDVSFLYEVGEELQEEGEHQ